MILNQRHSILNPPPTAAARLWAPTKRQSGTTTIRIIDERIVL